MGGGSWSFADYGTFRSARVDSAKTVDELYTSKMCKDELNPKNIKFREARDIDGLESVPIICGCDVTASMGRILEALARKGLGTIAEELFKRKPIEHPNLAFMAIGDVNYDRFPLQVTQFEADIKIAESLQDLYLESGGGGNQSESYQLPWYFAAFHVKADHIEKRKKRGYLFTFGDEETPPALTKSDINKVLGYTPEEDYSTEEILRIVRRDWYVYHIVLTEGSHCAYGSRKDATLSGWKNLLGEDALELDDYTKLGEVIVSIIEMNEKHLTVDEVAATWDGDTSIVLKKSLPKLREEAEEDTLVEF